MSNVPTKLVLVQSEDHETVILTRFIGKKEKEQVRLRLEDLNEDHSLMSVTENFRQNGIQL